jgi:hypothetical protein
MYDEFTKKVNLIRKNVCNIVRNIRTGAQVMRAMCGIFPPILKTALVLFIPVSQWPGRQAPVKYRFQHFSSKVRISCTPGGNQLSMFINTAARTRPPFTRGLYCSDTETFCTKLEHLGNRRLLIRGRDSANSRLLHERWNNRDIAAFNTRTNSSDIAALYTIQGH